LPVRLLFYRARSVEFGGMSSSRLRIPLWIGLGFCLGLGFLPLGCGGPAAETPAFMASSTTADLPAETVAALTACAEEGADRLKPPSPAIIFDVGVNADGHVETARVKDTTLDDPGISSCMVSALRAMSLPPSVKAKLRQHVSAESRRYTGTPAAPAVLIALGPIAITAAGVTIFVVVTVYVVVKVATSTRDATDDAEKERCKKVKEGCIEYCSDTILDQGLHEPLFSRCLRKCMEKANCL